jgi:hypothetical protein
MNWYPVLAAFVAHLAEAATPVPVSLGGDARVPNDARVVVVRGPATPGDPRRAQETTIQVWVECWEYAADADYAVGYERLATLENTISAAVLAFGQANQPIAGCRVRAELVGSIDGDGDVFRPSIGSRMLVNIRMRQA